MEEILLLVLALLAQKEPTTLPVTPPGVTPPDAPPVVAPPDTPPIVARPPSPPAGEYTWSGEFVGTAPTSMSAAGTTPYQSAGGWVVPPMVISNKQCFLQTKYGSAYQLYCLNFNGDRLIGTTTESPLLGSSRLDI